MALPRLGSSCMQAWLAAGRNVRACGRINLQPRHACMGARTTKMRASPERGVELAVVLELGEHDLDGADAGGVKRLGLRETPTHPASRVMMRRAGVGGPRRTCAQVIGQAIVGCTCTTPQTAGRLGHLGRGEGACIPSTSGVSHWAGTVGGGGNPARLTHATGGHVQAALHACPGWPGRVVLTSVEPRTCGLPGCSRRALKTGKKSAKGSRSVCHTPGSVSKEQQKAMPSQSCAGGGGQGGDKGGRTMWRHARGG